MKIVQNLFNSILLSHTLNHPFFTIDEIQKAISAYDRGTFNPDVNAVEIVRDVADRYSLDKMRRRLKYSFEELTDLYIKDYLKKRHAQNPFSADPEDAANVGLSPKEIQDKIVDAKELVELAVQFDTFDEEIAQIIIDSKVHIYSSLFGNPISYEFVDFLFAAKANLTYEAISMFVNEYIRENANSVTLIEHYAYRGLRRLCQHLIEYDPHHLPDFVGCLETVIESPVNPKQKTNLLLVLQEVVYRLSKDYSSFISHTQAILDKHSIAEG